ncbi:MAG: relaxase/mobilization nuclease domain-containing protein [Pseudomonadota bacterium]
MILKGSQRSGAKQLAAHLLNDRDNDHVTVLELKGFAADHLHGCLREAQAIAQATKCKQFLFSLSLNPPQDAVASEADFLSAADAAEQTLGLEGQPRAIVVHEKAGRRHAHVVWSRIDAGSLTAINLPHFKNRLTGLSKDLFLEHGWSLPNGLRTHGGKSFLNFSLGEWQQAKRLKLDPREIKSAMRDAWDRSDSLQGFANALEERGFFIAKGDRRGFVALDVQGTVFALPKWLGLKTREVRERLGSSDDLPSVAIRKSELKSKVTVKLKDFIAQFKDRHARDLEPLDEQRRVLIDQHRKERKRLLAKQEARAKAEAKARSERLRKGLGGLIDRLTGKARAIRETNAADAFACAKRDQRQRDDLVIEQMDDRRALQHQIVSLSTKHKHDRRLLARDVMQFLRGSSRGFEANDRERERARSNTPSRLRKGSRDRGSRFDL